jgi:hypothetical protein
MIELNDTFVMNKEDLIATLTDPKFTNPKAQVFYRTPDGELHPVGIALSNKMFNTVIELTDLGTARKLLGEQDDNRKAKEN